MHQFASGLTAAVGPVGAATPPLSTETIGRPPSILEAAPGPLKSFETILAERTEHEIPALEEQAPAAPGVRRVVVRLLGGEELELGSFDGQAAALVAAQRLVGRFSSAEAAGDWPELAGRFVRPASVASIDVLSAA